MRMLAFSRMVAVALVASALGSGSAFGHSGLERAEPAVDSKLKRAPSAVKLYFSERLEPAYSTVRVQDAHDLRVDRQDSHIDASNPRLLKVTLQPLEHGT